MQQVASGQTLQQDVLFLDCFLKSILRKMTEIEKQTWSNVFLFWRHSPLQNESRHLKGSVKMIKCPFSKSLFPCLYNPKQNVGKALQHDVLF
jgi:hypothetical protein